MILKSFFFQIKLEDSRVGRFVGSSQALFSYGKDLAISTKKQVFLINGREPSLHLVSFDISSPLKKFGQIF